MIYYSQLVKFSIPNPDPDCTLVPGSGGSFNPRNDKPQRVLLTSLP